MSTAPWKRYVKRLCNEAWGLDALATDKVLTRIEALIAADDLTDSAVARVLCRSGVPRFSADLISSSILVAIVV
jgi:hypothetical protein